MRQEIVSRVTEGYIQKPDVYNVLGGTLCTAPRLVRIVLGRIGDTIVGE